MFRRRIDYIRRKISDDQNDKLRKQYLSERGIKVSIANLEKFASELETQFVNHEKTARLLGEISNYNIRVTLDLARRVMTSAIFSIEHILSAHASQTRRPIPWVQFMNALLKGDYNTYRAGDIPQIVNVFEVNDRIKQSPLLHVRILILLQATANAAKDIEGKHLSVGSVQDYLEVCGCTESAADIAMEWLVVNGLVEKFDPSDYGLSRDQRVAITHAGRAHLKLSLEEDIYFEQMALTTSVSQEEVAIEIRDEYRRQDSYPTKLANIRHTFALYLQREDLETIRVEGRGEQFALQKDIDRALERHQTVTLFHRDGHDKEDKVVENVVATVDWYSRERGYGFVECSEVDGRAFIHREVLDASGIDTIRDGDDLVCQIRYMAKGPQVTKIIELDISEDAVTTKKCRVVRLFRDRGYGFVRPVDSSSDESDAFFHFSLLDEAEKADLCVDKLMLAEIKPDREGRGWQVRDVIEFYD